MSLLFFLPLISGLWSEDKTTWLEMIRIKLPLLFLPLAFAGPFSFSRKKWDWLAYIFVGMVIVASGWTLFHYVNNLSAVQEGYLKAKTMITPLENDHVRFSWLISVAVLLSGWLWMVKRKENEPLAYFLGISGICLVIFLHILAARTGLLSFYIMLAGVIVWLFAGKVIPVSMGRKYSFVLLLILLASPIIAYQTLPTFQNRVKYFMYDLAYFKKAHYRPGTNDAVRIISIQAGWNIMNQQPATGVGFGDILSETRKWYKNNYPEMLETDLIYPSSEWLIYGTGCGWPGIFLFGLVMIIPFRVRTGNRLLWILLNVTAAFGFLFDIGLEVQFGVFIYSFFILWWWKWMKADEKGLL